MSARKTSAATTTTAIRLSIREYSTSPCPLLCFKILIFFLFLLEILEKNDPYQEERPQRATLRPFGSMPFLLGRSFDVLAYVVKTAFDLSTGSGESSDGYDRDEAKNECVFYETLTFFFPDKTSDKFHGNPPDKFFGYRHTHYRKSNAKLQIFRNDY